MDGTLYGRDRVVNLKQPVLLMYGDKSIDGEMTETMASEDQKRRDRALGNEGYVLNIGEAGHLNFTDLPLYSPLIGFISPQAKRNHRIINETTVCFFDTSLKGLPDRECESSIRKYPDIRFKKGN
ncbi:hypothetical protein [Paenibacillus sp. DMB20]|uniref:hypothetical protein n=1 Tax=Paenibacillus sp. DMB20 TaxID=1642570 RepID=UPI000627FE76|nr:hypothetical protein [Paenibacillus sp. DMB20]KKO54160.1 hypothetical protein XI25_08845 [Paenibacillus sp. DMB20]